MNGSESITDTLTQFAEPEAGPGGLGAQAIGLGHPERVHRRPVGQLGHIAVLVGGVHDAGGPLGHVPPSRSRRGGGERGGRGGLKEI